MLFTLYYMLFRGDLSPPPSKHIFETRSRTSQDRIIVMLPSSCVNKTSRTCPVYFARHYTTRITILSAVAGKNEKQKKFHRNPVPRNGRDYLRRVDNDMSLSVSSGRPTARDPILANDCARQRFIFQTIRTVFTSSAHTQRMLLLSISFLFLVDILSRFGRL